MALISIYKFNSYRDKISNLFLTSYRKYCNNSNQIPAQHKYFKGDSDRFNGITINTMEEKCEIKYFTKILQASLEKWFLEGRRCIWFKVNINDSAYVPILADNGFNFHHARDNFVMMYKWLPIDSEPNLPPASHTNLGVGALVFNSKSQLLAISENHYQYPHWKLPGGYVERGEDVIDAAVREVKEETGVNSSFLTLLTFRHQHNMMYGNSDIYMLLMMKALSEKIVLSQREVKDCKWMNVEEYVNHPHVHQFNRIIVQKAIDYKNRKMKLDLEKKTVKWAQFTREMTYLSVNDCDYN